MGSEMCIRDRALKAPGQRVYSRLRRPLASLARAGSRAFGARPAPRSPGAAPPFCPGAAPRYNPSAARGRQQAASAGPRACPLYPRWARGLELARLRRGYWRLRRQRRRKSPNRRQKRLKWVPICGILVPVEVKK